MQSKFIYAIDLNDKVVDVVLADEDYTLTKNETNKPIPDDLFNPRFDLNKNVWYEGASTAELEEVQNTLNSI